MSIIDTSLVIERIKVNEQIDESICMVTAVEYPPVLEYSRFNGKVLSPDLSELRLAVLLQKDLRRIGRAKNAADLIIAATCINHNEGLLTIDSDFEDIAKVSELQIVG